MVKPFSPLACLPASFGGMHANELWLRQHFLLSQVWVEGKGVGSNAAGMHNLPINGIFWRYASQTW